MHPLSPPLGGPQYLLLKYVKNLKGKKNSISSITYTFHLLLGSDGKSSITELPFSRTIPFLGMCLFII